MRAIKFRAWDGDATLGYKTHGYQLRKAGWHPHCSKRGYVMEHRLVMEAHLGDYLPKHAIIHHKNGVRDDNGLENLEYMEEQERHAKHHDNGKRNPNGQFVATDTAFKEKKFRLLNKNTGLMQVFDLAKLISTTFRRSQFEYRGEFTGLKDKNGVEIYEGDIVTADNLMCLVEWESRIHGWAARWKHNRGGYSHPSLGFRAHEVIGNIHQNPEVLERAET